MLASCISVFFFFSSRRRHTRYIGDWSSDVCSSDLFLINIEQHNRVKITFPVIADLDQKVARAFGMVHEAVSDTATVRAVRSEERRVGKECRSRGAACDEKEKEEEQMG